MHAETQLWFGLGYLIVMVALAYVFKRNPPKEINWVYGYRTRRSMANETVWKAANTFWLQLFLKWQLYCLAIPVLGYFIFPKYTIWVTIVLHLFIVIATIPATEIYLNKHFDKNGNPK